MGLLARIKALSGGWVPLGHLPGPQNLGEGHEVQSQGPFFLALSWPGGPGAQGSAQSQGRLAVGWRLGSPCLPAWPVWFSVCLLGSCGPRPPPLTLAPLPPCASPRPLSLFSPSLGLCHLCPPPPQPLQAHICLSCSPV